jgi:hypothetical protein
MRSWHGVAVPPAFEEFEPLNMSPRQSAVQPAKPLDADGTRFAQCKATGLWLSMRPIEAARSLFSQWSALSKRALVPNIFY